MALQREYAHLQQEQEEKSFGGTRNFGLPGLLGCTAAFPAERMESALAFAAIVAIKNPFELAPALTFGLIYALILLAANTSLIAQPDPPVPNKDA